MSQISTIAAVLFVTVLVALRSTFGDDAKPISVHATNYTQVPSVTYIVNAVEFLTEAYSIYDNDEDRAYVYASLFSEKYNGIWNVLVGYSTVYVHSEIYIETVVSGGSDDDKSSDDASEKKFFLFSQD